MANGKNRVSMAVKKNQITDFVTKYKELENNIKNLLAKPLSVMAETVFVTAINGVEAAAVSVVFETISIHLCSVLPFPQNLKIVPGKRMINARDFGLLVGVGSGLNYGLKKIRGKDDVQARMIAGFGAGVVFMMFKRENPAVAITYGVILALAKAGLFKALEKNKSSQ